MPGSEGDVSCSESAAGIPEALSLIFKYVWVLALSLMPQTSGEKHAMDSKPKYNFLLNM